MRVNLSKVSSEGGFVLLPPSEYRVFLFNSEAKTSQNGTDFMNCEFKIADGSYKGSVVFDRLFLSEAALWRLKQFAEAVQYPCVDAEEGFDTSELFAFAQGQTLVVRVYNEPYTDKNGQEKKANRIDAFKIAEGKTDEGNAAFNVDDDITF